MLLGIFVPVGFLGGLTGKIYQQFAVTLSTAVVFSSVCALTLSPALCTVFLKNAPEGRRKFVLFRIFDAFLLGAGRLYVWASGIFARHVVLLALFFLVLVCFAIATAKSIPQAFIPHEDQGTVMVDANLPDRVGPHDGRLEPHRRARREPVDDDRQAHAVGRAPRQGP